MNEWITRAEICAHLGITRRTLSRQVKAGKIQAAPHPTDGRATLYKIGDIIGDIGPGQIGDIIGDTPPKPVKALANIGDIIGDTPAPLTFAEACLEHGPPRWDSWDWIEWQADRAGVPRPKREDFPPVKKMSSKGLSQAALEAIGMGEG